MSNNNAVKLIETPAIIDFDYFNYFEKGNRNITFIRTDGSLTWEDCNNLAINFGARLPTLTEVITFVNHRNNGKILANYDLFLPIEKLDGSNVCEYVSVGNLFPKLFFLLDYASRDPNHNFVSSIWSKRGGGKTAGPPSGTKKNWRTVVPLILKYPIEAINISPSPGNASVETLMKYRISADFPWPENRGNRFICGMIIS
jgi:hypothetical protein